MADVQLPFKVFLLQLHFDFGLGGWAGLGRSCGYKHGLRSYSNFILEGSGFRDFTSLKLPELQAETLIVIWLDPKPNEHPNTPKP